VTNKQKRIAFRLAGYLALALGVFGAYCTHGVWGWLALFNGIIAICMAVAEVMNRADECAAKEVERLRSLRRGYIGVSLGMKPDPPGVEYIREGSDPAERP